MIAQQLCFYYLYRDTELRHSIQALADFYYSKIDQNMGKLPEMNQKLDEKILNDMEALRNQVISNNHVELASIEVLDLQMKYERG